MVPVAPPRRYRRLRSSGAVVSQKLPTVQQPPDGSLPRNYKSLRRLTEVDMPSLSLSREKDQNGIESKRRADTVRVVVRCRPMNATELARGDPSPFRLSPSDTTTLQVVSFAKNSNNNRSGSARELVRSFSFDLCASGGLSQMQFFQECGVISLLESVVEGYLATVFAYGQTGSGKTYSMSGLEEQGTGAKGRSEQLGMSNSDTMLSDGLIPRALRHLFALLEQAPTNVKTVVRASFCEIYNEQVLDLLNPGSGALNVRWNALAGFYVQDLLVVRCDSLSDALAVVNEGHRNRHVASHSMNADSSRSHSLLTIHVDRTETLNYDTGASDDVTRYGKICFVDLAGSERLRETNSSSAEETSNINRSLLTLGKVISALAALSAGGVASSSGYFIPYRDSKLTKLLMDSLGGQSLTLMIACVSPSTAALEDTLSTLNYATRAKNIRNKPVVQVDPIELQLSTLRHENQLLRNENQELRLRLQFENPTSNSLIDQNRRQSSLINTPFTSQMLPATTSQGELKPALSPESLLRRNQLQALQDNYRKLEKWAAAAKERLTELQNENLLLRDQKKQEQRVSQDTISSGSEMRQLRQQVQQLQQHEQELMLALSRRSRGRSGLV